jgi:hypothetical protein
MRRIVIFVFPMILLSGCRRATVPPPQPAQATIRMLTEYSPGMPLAELIAAMRLDATEVRYRSGLAADRKSAVYFFQDGELHVDAQERDGVWVLSAIPFYESKTEPPAERLKKWDEGAEQKSFEQNPLKRMH